MSVLNGYGQAHDMVCEDMEQAADSVLTEASALATVEFRHDYKFRPNQLIAPASMLAVGVAGVWGFSGLKESVRHHFSGSRVVHFDNFLQYTPGVVYMGLGFIPGVKCRSEGWRDRVMAGVSAYAVMMVMNNVMKVSFRERRPNSERRNSFPSGHTAVAFTGAELMRIEYGNWAGFAAYAVAVTVGATRIYNDRHWINDVIGGAAVGILSARIGYWLLPVERRLFGLDRDKSKKTVAILPMAGEANGISFAMTF